MSTMGQKLLGLKKALDSGERLSDEEVALLATLKREQNVGKRHVAVSKLALREGEELWDFMWTMVEAVQTNRIILADGSLDAWLQGIYDDHVIVQDGNTGRMFKANFTRDANGEISFSDPVEVRMEWVPVESAAPEMGGEDVQRVEKRAAPEVKYVEVMKRSGGKWGGILPEHFQSRR